MPLRHESIPLRLALIYAGVATVWIVGSDLVVNFATGGSSAIWLLNTGKGLAFVAVTSVLLHLTCRHFLRKASATLEAQRESELRLKFALEGSGEGMWDWDLEKNTVYCSTRALELFGYREGEFVPSFAEWEKRIHPDDRESVQMELDRHFRGETENVVIEHRLQTGDGSYRWALTRGKVISRGPDGKPRRMLGLVADSTERRESQARLEEAVLFNEALIHASPFGIICYRAEGQALNANQSAARMLGTTVPELLRQNFREIENWQRHGLLALAEQALATGKNEPFDIEYVSSFGRKMWLSGSFVPFTFRGESRLLTVFKDTWEEKLASGMLNILQSAIRATDNGWLVTDAEGVILWVNPGFTEITGFSSSEAIGQTPGILKSGKMGRDFYARLWATIRRGEVWDGDIENRRKDGTLYQQRMTIVPVRGPDGVITNYVAITHDITAHRQLEEQVHRTQRLESIGMLASGVAHDLNNILAPILMSIELLKMKFPDSDARHRLDMIESASQRGAGIVRQVLTFARGMEGERIEIQPKHLVKDLLHLMQETFPRDIEIRMNLGDDIHPVVGDPTQLHQVLLNLAVNARDAMPQGGVLTIGAENVELDEEQILALPGLKPGPHVAFRVSDTGSGIPPEVLDHIFEPFFTTKVRGKGSGLGLSTVYGLVRSHGGAVQVRSALGLGSEFTVMIPANRQEAEMKLPTAPPFAFSGDGRWVLVVDDEEPIREITTGVLERHGFRVVAAFDGQDGWEKFQAEPQRYAAAIVDMMMPRMRGLELAGRMRTISPQFPIIASSGLLNSDSRSGFEVEATEQRVSTLLRKPYTEGQLLAALIRALPTETS